MTHQRTRSRTRHPSITATLCGFLSLLAGCGTGTNSSGDFEISSINVPDGAEWKINRPLRFEFSAPVDFSSVNLNTINVRQHGGAPSAGEFYLEAPNVVVFQPRCPILGDLSDAGLLPGGVLYDVTVLGVEQQTALTVRSIDGVSLRSGNARSLRTPISDQIEDLFFDSLPLPPAPVIRAVGEGAIHATYLELGGDPGNRVYLERNALGQIELEPDVLLPLNLLADPASRVALMLHLDQAVDPSPSNVNASHLSWQFRSGPASGDWLPLATDVELLANCTQTGALVRIEPLGILPPDAQLRVAITAGFRDIVGESIAFGQEDLAAGFTRPAPSPLADQSLEEFANAANADLSTSLGDPFAEWGGGGLRPNFSFTGSGGPNGDFDWRVPAGTNLIFSTNSQNITGGPNFSNQVSTIVIGGVLDVDDLRIEAGAVLKVQGTNPFLILAAGDVQIDGELNVSGTDSPGVTSINMTFLPEVGAPGQAGGGKGGTGSPLTTASSPRAGSGFGAFNQPSGGGQGGETGWNNVGPAQINGRRGAGGGGGSFGANEAHYGNFDAAGFVDHALDFGDWDQGYIGLDAENGFDNTEPSANGAITGLPGPFGGAAGARPFADANPDNDFFGIAVDAAHGNAIVQGELKKPWAGAGGGGGGDASFVGVNQTFPAVPFKPAGDERGAGGGGGGGSLRILALGSIRFGPNGRIVCRGGSGGGGENTINKNRVGGGSGGGSGGHVILEAGGVIDFSQSLGASSTAGVLAGGILATGGEGGAGQGDEGGAFVDNAGKHELAPAADACHVTSLGALYSSLAANPCADPVDGAGGDGGPGLIQLHVADPAKDILLPTNGLLTDVCRPAPVGRFYYNGGAVNAPFKAEEGTHWRLRMVPSFGSRSIAQSRWIPLGQGGFVFPNSHQDVAFEFGGTDPASGLVRTTQGIVDGEPAILSATLGSSAPQAFLKDAFTVVLPAASFAPATAHLLHPPELLRRFAIELSRGSSSASFDVVAAHVDNAAQPTQVTLTVDGSGGPMTPTFGPGDLLELRPAHFRIHTDGQADALPDSATVQVLFQATTADAQGLPLPPASGFTPDIQSLNTPGNSGLRYLRFQILFDIAAGSGHPLTPSSPLPMVDFLRIPYRYE